jgi:hypothetical protein
MFNELTPVGSGKALLDLTNEPFFMADKTLDSLENKRFTVSPKLRRQPRQFAFQFGRKMNFHDISLVVYGLDCQSGAFRPSTGKPLRTT